MPFRSAFVAVVLMVLPAAAAEPVKLIGHTQELYAHAFAPAGDRLATSANDGTVRVWTLADGKAVVIKTGAASRTVAFSQDGKRVAGRFEAKAALWDAATGELVAVLAGPDTSKDSTVRRVTFSPDGKLLAVGHDVGLVRLWDTATLKPAAELVRPGRIDDLQYTVTALAFSPDGKFLAAGSGAGAAVWTVATASPAATLSEKAKTLSAEFTPDGTKLLANEEARVGTLRVWDVAGWKNSNTTDIDTTLDRHLSAVRPVDGALALGVNGDGQLEYFDMAKATRTKSAFATPYRLAPGGFAISPDRKSVAHYFGGNIYTVFVEPLPAAK